MREKKKMGNDSSSESESESENEKLKKIELEKYMDSLMGKIGDEYGIIINHPGIDFMDDFKIIDNIENHFPFLIGHIFNLLECNRYINPIEYHIKIIDGIMFYNKILKLALVKNYNIIKELERKYEELERKYKELEKI